MPYLDDDDIVHLRRPDGSEAQYYWGDECELLGRDGKRLEVRIIGKQGEVDRGFIDARTTLRASGLVRLSVVDVQQGDGLILETLRAR